MSSAIKLGVWNPKYAELYSLLTQNIAKTAKLYETQLIVCKYIVHIYIYIIQHIRCTSQLYPNTSSAAQKGPSPATQGSQLVRVDSSYNVQFQDIFLAASYPKCKSEAVDFEIADLSWEVSSKTSLNENGSFKSDIAKDM